MAIVIIGNPNVGKSAVLNRLSGSNILVSNYPGTSTEISANPVKIGKKEITIFDTPGIYSIFSEGEEQKAIRDLFEREEVDLILNIVDASNLERNLVLSYELMDLALPVLMLLNQIDRARALGIRINEKLLSELLKIPVIPFSATTGEGLQEVWEIMESSSPEKKDKAIKEEGQRNKENLSRGKKPLQECSLNELRMGQCNGHCGLCSIPADTCMSYADWGRVEKARTTADMVSSSLGERQRILLEKTQAFFDSSLLGTPVLLLLAYLAFVLLLKFVAISEGPITALLEPLNQTIESFLSNILPPGMLNTILSKAVPEGLIIPFSIIMPAMLMVACIMSLLEDSGLLPRYSVALERAGSFFGISGEAIIPLSLGFGCRTPAIMASRIMPTASQRFIVITLLSIVVPCAATLGILASVIAAFQASLPVIVGTMFAVLMLMGFILSRLMPREDAFIYELPPLRFPLWSNVGKKVKMRFSGFFTEVLPLLLIMSIAVRALLESGFLEIFRTMEAFTRFLFGIPAEAFIAVLVTIFQRYLAPLVLLNLDLTPREATIAISMIALSLPCLPAMVMTVREIGWSGLTKILGLGFLTSCSVGIMLNLIL